MPRAKYGQMTHKQAVLVFYENITDFAKLISDTKDNVLIRLECIKYAQQLICFCVHSLSCVHYYSCGLKREKKK
jgi:hypothetical protein